MKRALLIAALAALLVMTAGCITSPMQGALFTFTTHSVHGESSGSVIGTGKVLKQGQSCGWGSWLPFLNLVYFGQDGVQAAAKKAGITKIAAIDRKSMAILGPIFHRECTVVWGE